MKIAPIPERLVEIPTGIPWLFQKNCNIDKRKGGLNTERLVNKYHGLHLFVSTIKHLVPASVVSHVS